MGKRVSSKWLFQGLITTREKIVGAHVLLEKGFANVATLLYMRLRLNKTDWWNVFAPLHLKVISLLNEVKLWKVHGFSTLVLTHGHVCEFSLLIIE